MTDKEIQDIRTWLGTGKRSELVKVFFNSGFRPREETYYSSEEILSMALASLRNPKKLEDLNCLEKEGLAKLLGASLAHIRRGCRDRKQAWVDFELKVEDAKYTAHGFTDDLAKVMDSVRRSRVRANKYRSIATTTKRIVYSSYPQLPAMSA